MEDEEQLHALYRYRGDRKRQPPLYIGQTNNPMRRTGEHWRSKPWITETARIDVEWFPADEIDEAERQAIRREHPIYNVHHNGGRLRIQVAAEVTLPPPSPESLAAMLAVIVAGCMAAVWVFDSLANWSVKRRAERAALPVELPPARNLFAQDPPHWSAQLLVSLLRFAAPTPEELEERELRRQEALVLPPSLFEHPEAELSVDHSARLGEDRGPTWSHSVTPNGGWRSRIRQRLGAVAALLAHAVGACGTGRSGRVGHGSAFRNRRCASSAGDGRHADSAVGPPVSPGEWVRPNALRLGRA